MIVKPALKLSAARIVDSPVALERVAGEVRGRVLVQPVIDDEFHGLGGLAYQGRLVATMRTRYLRLWPQPCGTVAAARPCRPMTTSKRVRAHLLRDYDGPFHLDFVGRYLLDGNPRITPRFRWRFGAGPTSSRCTSSPAGPFRPECASRGRTAISLDGRRSPERVGMPARDAVSSTLGALVPSADRSQLRLDLLTRSVGRARPLHVPPGERRASRKTSSCVTRHDVVEWRRNVDVERSLTAGHDVSPGRHLARELGTELRPSASPAVPPTFEDDEHPSRQETPERPHETGARPSR